MKTVVIRIVAAIALGTFAGCDLTSCASTGGTPSVITNVQTWLNDPKNQAIIQEIASAANILIGVLAEHRGATTTTTVVGKLAVQFPGVPAGALSTIARNPKAYLKGG